MSKTQDELMLLLQSAQNQGVVSQFQMDMVTGNLGSVVLAGAAGKALEDIEASEVTLVTVLIDASSSIASSGLEDAIRQGQHALLDAFAGSKELDAVLTATWTFSNSIDVIHSYLPVKDAVRLNSKNYHGSGSTSLYDTWCAALTANVAYAQRLNDGGTPTRSVVVVVTDGEDVGSQKKLRDCAQLSRDLLATEVFTLAFVGVGNDVNFTDIAQKMGVPKSCILVEKDATASALRRAFQLVSRSAVRASQGHIKPGVAAQFFVP
jgi:hypothetical protein